MNVLTFSREPTFESRSAHRLSKVRSVVNSDYIKGVAGVCGGSCRCVWRELQVCVEGVAGVCGGSCRCVAL